MKKQLHILCINSGYGNTAASINLINNKAFNFSKLKYDSILYSEVPEKLKSMAADLQTNGKIYDTIVDMLKI